MKIKQTNKKTKHKIERVKSRKDSLEAWETVTKFQETQKKSAEEEEEKEQQISRQLFRLFFFFGHRNSSVLISYYMKVSIFLPVHIICRDFGGV